MKRPILYIACCGILFSALLLVTHWWIPVQAGRVLNDSVTNQKSAQFSHHVWQAVLVESVDGQGHVDFNTLRARPRQLNQYLDQLAAVSPESHPDRFKSNNERLAYWINAYNALSLRTVLDYYPINSLEEIPGGLPAFRNQARYRLGGKMVSLHALEQKVVKRFYWKAPTFFALTDLGKTSPPLWNQAYQGESLDEHLALRIKAFIDNSQNVTVRSYCTPVLLSPVFHQFQRPFVRYTREELQIVSGNILDFIRPYSKPIIRGYLSKECDREIIYHPFNHQLQELP